MDIDIQDTARTLSFEGHKNHNMAVTNLDWPERFCSHKRLQDSDSPEESHPCKWRPDSRNHYPLTLTPLLASFSHSVFESPLGNTKDQKPSDRKLA